MPVTMQTPNIVFTQKDFAIISELVGNFCGINLHFGKRELVRARLGKLLRNGEFRTFSEYIEHVLADDTGVELTKLIDAISTNLTSFFRENQHYEFLRKQFIPSLILKKCKKRDFRIRAWSAGCSSGEEPYSMAITMMDAFEGNRGWDVKVLATDISTQVLKIAKSGLYMQDRISPLTPLQKQKYLTPDSIDEKTAYRVSKPLRKAVIFRYLNLMDQWPIKGPLDFIFCRNVMIYFGDHTQERLVNRFWDMLDTGGMLFTGHSESLSRIKHKFKYVQPSIYVKQ